MNTITRSLAALATTAPLALATAHAAPEDLGREGPTFGIALGGGSMKCSSDGCEELSGAGSLDLHAGGMLQQNLALIFDAWGMVHTEDRLTVSQVILDGAFRVWPIDHFWLQGGLGIARAAYSYDADLATFDDHSEWVPAFALAVGVEPLATPDIGLDIALRYGTGFYSDGDFRVHNLALTLGVSFY